MKKFFKIFKVYEWIFLLVSILTLLVLGILSIVDSNKGSDSFNYLSLIELFSALFGIIGASLNLKRKKYAFFFYIGYSIMYGVSSLIYHQYGEAILNLVINLIMYLYTVFNFYIKDRIINKKKNNKNKELELKEVDVVNKEGNNEVSNNLNKTNRIEKTSTFNIKRMNKIELIIIIILIPLFTLGYGYVLKLIESDYPFINALATSLCLISVYFTSRGILEQWIFWDLYSIVLVVLWSIKYSESQSMGGNAGLLLMIINIIYVILNTYALIEWINTYRKKKKDEIKTIKE